MFLCCENVLCFFFMRRNCILFSFKCHMDALADMLTLSYLLSVIQHLFQLDLLTRLLLKLDIWLIVKQGLQGLPPLLLLKNQSCFVLETMSLWNLKASRVIQILGWSKVIALHSALNNHKEYRKLQACLVFRWVHFF